jgi:hypothetical protein
MKNTKTKPLSAEAKKMIRILGYGCLTPSDVPQTFNLISLMGFATLYVSGILKHRTEVLSLKEPSHNPSYGTFSESNGMQCGQKI